MLHCQARMHTPYQGLKCTSPTAALPGCVALQAAFPHPATEQQRACVELLGALNADITGRALQLMASGEVAQLGALMSEAQRLFTARAAPLCPSQLTSPVLHRVLAHPPIQRHIYGGKGVGSQVGWGWPAGGRQTTAFGRAASSRGV